MNNYELWIQQKEGGEYMLADLGDTIPDMSYGVNDVAQLENRQANASMTIKLPLSNNNCQIFEHAQIPNVVNDFPYRRHNCRLLSNSRPIAGIGSFLILKRVTDTDFECQILSGLASFFTTLKETPMSNLDLGYVTRANQPFIGIGNDTFIIPYITSQREGVREVLRNNGFPLPVVYIPKVMNEICEQNEYSLIHNLGEKWDDYTTNICDLQPDERSGEVFDFKAEARESRFEYGIEWNEYIGRGSWFAIFNQSQVQDNGLGSLTLINTDPKGAHATIPGYNGFKYTSRHSGKIAINLRIDITSVIALEPDEDMTLTISRKNLSGEIENLYSRVETGPLYFHFYFSEVVDVAIGDEITMAMTVDSPNGIEYAGYASYSLTGTTIVENQVPIGFKIPISKNLGFETQNDYFKAMVQAFGLTVNVNEAKKTVEIYTMEKVYENKQFAKDWTRKLHSKDITHEFTIRSYAMKNFISMQDNADDEVLDTSFFSVDNNTLERSKDLFTLPFESGKDYLAVGTKDPTAGRFIANVPLTTKDENGNITFTTGKPHLLKKHPELSEYIAIHIPAQELIDVYYDDLTNKMLNRARMLEGYFLLDEWDIEDYVKQHENGYSGCFIPIYLQQTGRYYYINDIKNFQNGRLTKVQLIRM